MPFFVALAILIAASSAYLLHQFWSHTLSAQDDLAASPAADEQAQPSHLKAA